jgi:lipoprotein-anchoring transpeptidase ErfK/SrfK
MFIRSTLTIAIALCLNSYAFAENKAVIEEQPLQPAPINKLSDINNQAPVADQATGNTGQNTTPSTTDNKTQVSDQAPINSPHNDTPAETVTPQTEQALKNAEAVVDTLPANPHESKTAASQAIQDWSLDGLNNAEWTTDLGKGQFTAYAKAQVLLNRAHSSPGAIDGVSGKNMLKAVSAFQVMHGLPVDGLLNTETWAALTASQSTPAFSSYTIAQEDIDGPYAASIPHDYAQQAKMKGLYYTRVTEMLGERFHMDEDFLKKLNPNANFKKLGESIIVANTREDLSEPVALLIAHKGAKQVYAFDSNNKMVASFPATIGSSDTPSPKGTYKIKAIAPNPWYGYNPKNFIQGKNMKPLSLPPGPNNPVGLMWIALSKPSFGIHGTPNPSTISKSASHGCIRLTNWDAVSLSKRVQAGVTVKFLE